MQLEQKYLSFCNILGKANTIDVNKIKTCFTLLSVANSIDLECSKRLQEFHLSESRLIILVLLNEYYELSLHQIAHFLGISKASTTTLVNALINNKLINKKIDQEDKRVSLVSLTDQGAKLLDKILQKHSAWIEKITTNISTKDITKFERILQQIHLNVLAMGK